MVFLNSEGRFNDNSYLIDGLIFRLPGQLSLYIVENQGMRMMIDVGEELAARKILRKLKNLGLYPIHKILLTHSHFDHTQAVEKLKMLMKENEIEVLASEKAISSLKSPKTMNEYFGYTMNPINDVSPLKEEDIIDLNGLELEVLNFFGHTQDSIAIFDKKNRNIFVGDAIIDKLDYQTLLPEFVPPDFNEAAYFKTLNKLENMRDELDSISLAHFGVWKGEDLDNIVENAKDFHLDAKESIRKWYNEDPSIAYITLKYHEKFIPDSKIHTRENIHGLEFEVKWFVDGLKSMGIIK
jgi:glyoxylase-like metal-dependent hydrolase (beta-lactamase superfamily II)